MNVRYVTLGLMFLITAAISWLWPQMNHLPGEHEIAQALLDRGEPDSAILLFDEPVWRGIAEYRAGRFERAIGEFYPPENMLELYNAGTTYAQLEDWNGAISALEKVLRLDPEHEDARHNLDTVLQLFKIDAQNTARPPTEPEMNVPAGRKSDPLVSKQGEAIKTGDGEGADNESAGSDIPTDDPGNSDKPGELGDQNAIDHAGAADAIGQIENLSRQSPRAEYGAAEIKARESHQAAEVLLKEIVDDPEKVLRQRLYNVYMNRAGAK